MKGISRRARACAVVAVTGVAVLAGSTAASAQFVRSERAGNGVPTGQLSTIMFNYGTYLNNGGNTGSNATTPNPVTGVSTGCLTATSTACRWERLEQLFAFFQRKGVTGIELFGHQGYPADTNIEGDTTTMVDVGGKLVGQYGMKHYRALLDKYGLHAGGQHASTNEDTPTNPNWTNRINAAKVLGADYLGSGGLAQPGIGSYAGTLATAQTLNRLGKQSVEAGVGPVYIHNHQGEFTTRYTDGGANCNNNDPALWPDGQLPATGCKSAWQIVMERTDPRWVAAEVDLAWASDAHRDVTGAASAALINAFPTRVHLVHAKDAINVDEPAGGNPRAFGTGEIDFRPIFTATANRVRYYHHEQDSGTLVDADISFSNLKGTNAVTALPSQVKGALRALPTSFPTVAAGTPAAANVVPVTVENSGDAPLTITAVAVQAEANDGGNATAADFQVVSQNCSGTGNVGPLAAGKLAVADDPATADVNEAAPAVPRGTCVVNVGFKPTRTNYKSVARLQFTTATPAGGVAPDTSINRALLVGQSSGDLISTIGGDVPTMLALSIQSTVGSFGTFQPTVARNYETALAGTVTSTAANATLSVSDASTVFPGHLVNGAFGLPQPLNARAINSSNPTQAFVPLAEATGVGTPLLSWAEPVTSQLITLGFRQAIGASDALRAGTYSKTLTFTLSTTTP